MESKLHDIVVLHKFGEHKHYGKIGVLLTTRTKGCHKLLLDYMPYDPNAPVLIIVSDELGSPEIVETSWTVVGRDLTHRVYGYTPYGEITCEGKRPTAKVRIGSVFRSAYNERVYNLKINQWPRRPETDILAFETSFEERETSRDFSICAE